MAISDFWPINSINSISISISICGPVVLNHRFQRYMKKFKFQKSVWQSLTVILSYVSVSLLMLSAIQHLDWVLCYREAWSIHLQTVDILLQLYKLLVRLHLEYCTAAWLPHYQKDNKLLEKIQRQFTRMVPGLREVPYQSRLKSLKLWSLEHRRVRADLIEVFKMFQGLSIVDINAFFEHDSTTGRTLSEVKERVCVYRQHFFSERIITIWNRLESSVVESQSLNIFKSKLQALHNKDESFLDNTCLIDSRGRASPPGEASSDEFPRHV